MILRVSVMNDDVTEYKSDVLVLKYAQGLFGADELVYKRINQKHPISESKLPELSNHIFIKSYGSIATNTVLFLGVLPLYNFGYQQIREFIKHSINIISKEKPEVQHISFTLHGVNYGLDELESFESELAGILDAVTLGNLPENLQRISFVEKDKARYQRMHKKLCEFLPNGVIEFEKFGKTSDETLNLSDKFRSVGYASNSKPKIFVAMPFSMDMEDLYHYGIQGAVNNAGFLCERADLSYFTGAIMDWVKKRIKDSKLIIADLTKSNSNVYLEVGYAWGCNKPTILLTQNTEELKFDVKGERCIVYSTIKELEEKLTKELNYFYNNDLP